MLAEDRTLNGRQQATELPPEDRPSDVSYFAISIAEVYVVLAIITFLIGLLLPAVDLARPEHAPRVLPFDISYLLPNQTVFEGVRRRELPSRIRESCATFACDTGSDL